MTNVSPLPLKPDAKKCCPAEELQNFVLEHHLPEAREGLKLRASLVEHAESLKAKAATRAGLDVDNATFVGIHNRRTDYLEYMETKYGEKTQFNR